MLQDPRKFSVSSDYPMDFIVWYTEGTLTDTPDGGEQYAHIAHHLPYTPLVFGILSTDDGTTWEAFGPEHSGFWSWAEADSTEVRVALYARTDPVTIKFKLWGYPPSDGSGIVDIINTGAQDNVYHIDSDLDYSKLVKAGVWDVVKGDRVVVYNHALGFIPQVATWQEYDSGIIWDGGCTTSTDTAKQFTSYVQIDENNLYAKVDGDVTSDYGKLIKIHYRIYGNGMEA